MRKSRYTILGLYRFSYRIYRNDLCHERRSIAKSAYCAGNDRTYIFFHCRITWFNLAAGTFKSSTVSERAFQFPIQSMQLLVNFQVSCIFFYFLTFIAIPRYEVNTGFAIIVLLLLDLLSSFNILMYFMIIGRWCKIYWHTIHFVIYVISFSCCSLFVLRLVFIVGLATRYRLTSLSSARKTSNVLKNSPSRPPTKGNTKLHTFMSYA